MSVTGLEVYLLLRRLTVLLNERSICECVCPAPGKVFSMSVIASPFFPAQAVAALLVQKCVSDGLLTPVAGELSFKLGEPLTAAAHELYQGLAFTMATVSVGLERGRDLHVEDFSGGRKNAVKIMPASENTKSFNDTGSKLVRRSIVVTSMRTRPAAKNVIRRIRMRLL